MKIKHIIVIYTVIMLFVMISVIAQIKTEEDVSIDMAYYNKELKQIEEELRSGISRENIESNHGCQFLFLVDDNYESILNKMIGKGAVILDFYEENQISGKLIWQTEEKQYEQLRETLLRKMLFLGMTVLLAGYGVLGVLYIYVIRPFQNLQQFTSEVAKGNLDVLLPMRKYNFFGAFTESFDIMREELKKAKESEYQANISKKELVAQLSHDIKTPVATIKATCEVLQVKEKSADTLEKVQVIAGKAEMIDNLISNMFHATLEELQALKVEGAEESSLCILDMFHDLKYYGEIIFKNELPECLLYMDKLRVSQVIDNIVNNSFKYAKTLITVSFGEREDGILLTIKDDGPGMPEEELAMATEKYYRGSNTKGKSGSGLGLYLAKNFMEQMNGGLECYCEEGFAVVLFLKKI